MSILTISRGRSAQAGWRLARGAAAAVTTVGLIVAFSASVSADPGPGQTERISFAPGTDHATVRGTVPAGDVDRYVLWAGAGQTMSLQSLMDTTPGVSVGVFAPDGTELSTHPSGTFEGQLPATGDYIVTVGLATSDVAYTMEVRIPAAHRVEFALGTDHDTITGSITDASTDRYVLWAAAGQTMRFDNVEPIHLSVTAPDGSVLPGGPGDSISFPLRFNGDYVVEVLPGMGEGDEYSITVTIPSAAGGNAAPRRLQFAPGTDQDTLSGSITDEVPDRYVLWAGAGQTMRFDHVEPFRITVSTPDGSVLPGGPGDTVEFQLPLTVDYVVEVLPGMGEGENYSITVTIPVSTGVSTTPQRVEFAPGTDHATLTGSITDSRTDRYVLRAGAGQTMTFEHVEPFHISVTAPDGTVLPGGPGDTISFQLPSTGDYVVEVLPGMGEGDAYSITLTIPAPPQTTAVDYSNDAFVAAWSSGDDATLGLLSTPDAVSAVHAHDDIRGGPWTHVASDGAMGTTYATYTDPNGNELTIGTGNEAAATGQPHAVHTVQFLTSPPTDAESYASDLVAAWLVGAYSRVELLATPEAAATLHDHDSDRSAGWQLPGTCEGAAGSTYCTFTAGSRQMIVRVGNEAAFQGQPHAVSEVQFP